MTHSISIALFRFNPQTITIAVGDSVQWTNREATTHSAFRSAPPAFHTEDLERNQTSSPITFTEASPAEGFGYVCDPHTGMTGTIIVVEPSEARR